MMVDVTRKKTPLFTILFLLILVPDISAFQNCRNELTKSLLHRTSLPFQPFHLNGNARTRQTGKSLVLPTRLAASLENTIEKDGAPSVPSNITEVTVKFPYDYYDLMDLSPGEFVTSETITVPWKNSSINFCVKLYPRGGGHSTTSSKGLDNLLGKTEIEKVGVYLQYLPSDSQDNDSTGEIVDATFSLRMKGKQIAGPRFDVEWAAGMRFVPLEQTNLREGRANDFGAHLMETRLLKQFLGVPGEEDNYDYENANDMDDSQVQMNVGIQIHPPIAKGEMKTAVVASEDSSFSLFRIDDIREKSKKKDFVEDDEEEVRVGKIVVPVLNRLKQRPKMFEMGAYPGVEYRILRILDPETGNDIFYSVPGAQYDLKPIYALVPQLERQWPVRVNEKDIPKLVTPATYNKISALGSLLTAVVGLTTAFIISQAISLFFIPSKSMDPTLQVGDVLLVEKITPKLEVKKQVGDVVLFSPPQPLMDIVSKSGGKISNRDLFVKRIAGEPGDSFSVDTSGAVKLNGEPSSGNRDMCEEEPLRLIEKFIQPTENSVVNEGEYFVLGDCSSVSVDSRVWGTLKASDIKGKPILRVWPPDRVGSIPPLPSLEVDWK